MMVKFFKPKPVLCSVCGVECFPKKKIRNEQGLFFYCESCWDYFESETRERVTVFAKEHLKEFKKNGRKIGVADLKGISDKITEELTKGD